MSSITPIFPLNPLVPVDLMNSIIDPKTGFFITSYFQKRIQEENDRSRRTNTPFSLVLIDFATLHSKNPPRGTDKETFLQTIVRIVRKFSRETDLKGWFDDYTVGIMLPDTPYSGAEALCGKLTNAIKARLRAYSPGDLFLNDCFAITSYPHIFNDNNAKNELNGKVKFINPVHIKIDKNKSAVKNGFETHSKKSDVLPLPLFPHEFKISCLARARQAFKRHIDIMVSSLAVIFCFPAFIIIAMAIKSTSPGPVLFKQKRVGRNGKIFIFFKFRTMNAGCDEKRHKDYVTDLIKNNRDQANCGSDEKSIFKMDDDTRVTIVGKVLRKSSLDELPQLLNVFKGEMSLVGPRPPIAYEVEQYENWHLRRLQEVKPGITGLWQVEGRSRTTFDEMVRLDILYINNWSLWLDFKIFLKTFGAVLSTKGAC